MKDRRSMIGLFSLSNLSNYGLFFCTFRHDDLKEMLDSNKDSLKLEAMKRIVAVSIQHCSHHLHIVR